MPVLCGTGDQSKDFLHYHRHQCIKGPAVPASKWLCRYRNQGFLHKSAYMNTTVLSLFHRLQGPCLISFDLLLNPFLRKTEPLRRQASSTRDNITLQPTDCSSIKVMLIFSLPFLLGIRKWSMEDCAILHSVEDRTGPRNSVHS